MAHILCITSGLTGILNASFELVHRLEALGHKVTSASPKDVGALVEAQGLRYRQLPAMAFDPAPPLPAHFSGPLRKVKRLVYKFRHRKSRMRQAIENLGMQEFRQRVNKLNPDLVIVDIELHEHIMTLQSESRPLLLLSQWFSTWDGKGLPPIQTNIVPGEGFQGSALGLWLSWKRVRLRRRYIFFKKKLTSMYTDRRSVLQAYAKQVGFPRAYMRKNYWPGPFSYEVLPAICMTAEALEFPHAKRTALTYVGPMVSVNRLDTQAGTDNRLEQLISARQAEQSKLIYCSVSTFSMGDVAFLQKVINAMEGQQNWQLIISLGGKLESESLGAIPANVHVFDRVPQLQVLAAADLSINHGGIHTINECLHFEVPMLVYSGKRSDQNGCASRVHYHQAGIMADKDIDSSTEIRNKIRSILDSPSMMQRMSELKETIYDDHSRSLAEVLHKLGVKNGQ